MNVGLINKADVYGINTQALFGENEPTTAQFASGNVNFDEDTTHAPVKTIVALVLLLVGLRLAFEYL